MKSFVRLTLPNKTTRVIPDDIALRFHHIKPAEIPWDDGYRQIIPEDLLVEFDYSFPDLHEDTKDVRTAICLGLMGELLKLYDHRDYDYLEIGLGFIRRMVHDDGATDGGLNFKISKDLDQLWKYTHENFWQMTVIQDIDPYEYWEKLKSGMESEFMTAQGLKFARRMLSERKDELGLYLKTLQGRV